MRSEQALYDRIIALTMGLVGVLAIVGGLFADPLGIGGAHSIGWKQGALVVLGTALTAGAAIALSGWPREPKGRRGRHQRR